jgi:hypothetical protein
VGRPSRRAAAVAGRGSAGIGIPLRIVEAEFTVEQSNLVLDADHHREMTGVGEGVTCVLKDAKQEQRTIEVVGDSIGRFGLTRLGHPTDATKPL